MDDKGKATSVGSGKLMLSPDDPQSVTLHAGRTRVVTIGGRCRRTSASSSWGRIATIAAAARKDSSCYESSSTYSEAEINKPMDSVYVPAGISSDKLEGLAGASYQLPTCQAMPSLTAPSRS